MKLIYRVVIKVSYNVVYFDFDTSEAACEFAATALKHMTESEDQPKHNTLTIEIVNPEESEDE